MILTTRRLATLIFFAGLLAMATRVAVDSDTFWHLRSGMWMLDHRQLLTFDVFSHTRLNQAWINHSWLTEIQMAIVFQSLGYAGLNLATALIVWLTFLCVYVSGEGGSYLRAFVVILSAAASIIYWSARPQIVSLLLTAVFNLILIQYRYKQINRLWLLPLLVVVWVNLHGGFAIGFILLFVTFFGQLIEFAIGGFRARQPILWLAATILLCLVAVLVNPYGPQMLLYPFRTVSIGALQNYIQEWRSPDFHQLAAQVFIVLWLLTFAAVGFAQLRLNITDLLLFSVFSALALLAVRNLAVFAVVVGPILMRYGNSALAELHERWPRLKLNDSQTISSRSIGLLNWALFMLVAAAVVFKMITSFDTTTINSTIAQQAPLGAAAYLKSHTTPGNLFNSYNYGGYLVWALYPDVRVFVDGRTDLYDDAFLEEYLNAYLAGSGWDKTLTRYNIGAVLVESNAPIARLLVASPKWAVRYSDARSVVIVRLP